MEIQQQTTDLLSSIDLRLSALKERQVDQINFLSPDETIAGEIRKLERLRDELLKEWYKTYWWDLNI